MYIISYTQLHYPVQSRFSLKRMLRGLNILGWLLSTGTCIANEVVNSVLMSGFTVTTSEVKPPELHILPICCGVGRFEGRTDAPHLKANFTVTPKQQGGKNHQNMSVEKTCKAH